jgi:hypothetical protein
VYNHYHDKDGGKVWHVDRLDNSHFVESCQISMSSLSTVKKRRRPKGKGRVATMIDAKADLWKKKQNWIRCGDMLEKPLVVKPPQLKRTHAFSETCDCVACVSACSDAKAMGEAVVGFGLDADEVFDWSPSSNDF